MTPDRLVSVSDLVLQKDIVEQLGLNPTAVANLAGGRRRNAGFPRPVTGHGNRGIWLWSEVETWYRNIWPSTVEGLRSAESAARIRRPHIAQRRRVA